MSSDLHTLPRQAGLSVEASSAHRVLRNTYALLALSMIPTVLGALFGTTVALPLMAGSPMMSLLLFFGVSMGLIFAIQANRNSGLGVVLLLAFTLFMGVMLGPLLAHTLQFRNGGQLIALAAGGTGAIFFVLAGIGSSTQRDFSKLGTFLFAGVVLLVLAGLANMFFQIPALHLTILVASIGIFSAFVLFDINRIVQGGETSYISATLAVYLDIYNIFTSLLQLLGIFGGDRD